jgi:predicted transcriptional regulator
MTVCQRDKIERVLHSLPSETTIEDAMERIYILGKVERGIQQVEAGEILSHDEAKKKLQKWLM